ncbi:hypothetical protein Bbelb_134520 [Branchiostoma belcheri]|nr:hypothetical protein Bbelb_134520 [Branchiostoma belcheri]
MKYLMAGEEQEARIERHQIRLWLEETERRDGRNPLLPRGTTGCHIALPPVHIHGTPHYMIYYISDSTAEVPQNSITFVTEVSNPPAEEQQPTEPVRRPALICSPFPPDCVSRVIGRASILTAGHGSLAVTPGYQFPATLQKLFVTRKSHLLRACKNCRAGLVESLYDVINSAVASFRAPECQAAGNLQPDNSQQLMFGTLRVFVMAFTAVSTAHTGDVFSSCTHTGATVRFGGSGGNNWSAFSSEEIAIKSPHFPPQSNDSRLILDLWRYHPTRALISPRESRANLRRPSHLAIMKPSRTGAPPRHLAHHTEQPSPPRAGRQSSVLSSNSPQQEVFQHFIGYRLIVGNDRINSHLECSSISRSPPGRGSAAPVRPDDRTFCWRMGPILEAYVFELFSRPANRLYPC